MWVIHTRDNCKWCTRAKSLLAVEGIEFREVHYALPEEIQAFKESGHKSFPQVYKGQQHIGGHDDLKRYLASQ